MVGIALLSLLGFFLYRRRRQQQQKASNKGYSGTTPFGPQHSESDLHRKYYDASPRPTIALSSESGYGFSSVMSQNASALALTQGSNTSAGAGNASHSHLHSSYAPSVNLASFSPTPAPVFPPGVTPMANGAPAPSILSVPMNVPMSVPMPPAGAAMTGNTTLGHAHTLSAQSTLSGGGYSMFSLGSEAPEGAISPYVLPPTHPESMGADATSGSNGGLSGHGSKGGSGGSGADLFTTASPTRRIPERRNPPAYSASPEPEEPTVNTSITSALGLGAVDGGGEALPAGTESQVLTGTTAAGSDGVASDAGGSNVAVGGDGEPGSNSSQASRDRYGYPIDRKQPR